jgi:decaprenylphospho-beta-D-erythro-pentofuranosid-2-ulose 2-reductase
MEYGKALLVLGGTSDIGRTTALRFAKASSHVLLAGRDLESLQREANDITARTGTSVSLHKIDILDTGSFASFVDGLPCLPDTIICVIGLLGEQARAENDLDHATAFPSKNHYLIVSEEGLMSSDPSLR